MADENQVRGEGALEREETIRDLETPSGSPQSPEEPFTEAEVKAFSEKLQSWGEKLPDREQLLLARVVQSAQGDEDDVGGFLFGQLLAPVALKLTGRLGGVAQDVTVNKAKTADKAFNAMDAYIRG